MIVDAGVGTASDAAIAMELGCDGVLMNTAIAAAQDPVLMARAMKKAVEAGREAFLAGRMPKKLYTAAPSSPTEGIDRVLPAARRLEAPADPQLRPAPGPHHARAAAGNRRAFSRPMASPTSRR